MNILHKMLNRAGYLTKEQAEVVRYDTTVERAAQNVPPAWSRASGDPGFNLLRRFADDCEAVGICIQKRTAQMLCVPWEIVPKDETNLDGSALREVEIAEEFFDTDGGLGGPGNDWESFCSSWLNDLLTIGCAALYRRPSRGKAVFSVEIVDAGTISPVLTPEGWVPQEGPAFEQFIQGRKVADFGADEMYYSRLNVRSHSKWGRSPTAMCLRAIRQFSGYDEWNEAWLTDGDANMSTLQVPDTWTYDLWTKFEEKVKALNETIRQRQSGMVMMPPGTTLSARRPRGEAEYDQTQVRLITRIAAAFDLNPAVLGFASEVHKYAQEEQRRLAEVYGQLPILLKMGRLLNSVLHNDLGLTQVEFKWNINAEDRNAVSQIAQRLGSQYLCTNDVLELLGRPAVEGPLANTYFVMAGNAPVIVGHRKDTTPEQQRAAEEAASAARGAVSGTGIKGDTQPAQEPAAPNGAEAQLTEAAKADLSKWRRKALRIIEKGDGDAADFTSEAIPEDTADTIRERLQLAKTADEVREAFRLDEVDLPRLAGDLEDLLKAVRSERHDRANWSEL